MNEALDPQINNLSNEEKEFDRSLRPLNFSDFVGQESILENLKVFVEAANRREEALDNTLFNGPPWQGKSTLAYHIINYVLSIDEDHSYDLKNYKINPDNKSFKLIFNKSNPNFISIDIEEDKKSIDINQIRNLISSLNKSSFNEKPRFVLIDNIELLIVNSVNALLKIVEEPNDNIDDKFDGGMWRIYELQCEEMTCLIHEEFHNDAWEH